uniref:Uncharacterized protein n=1 Tax=Eutreptiella gymnastica TaxID=73025 RepID=A0A7S4GMF5_9EUGL
MKWAAGGAGGWRQFGPSEPRACLEVAGIVAQPTVEWPVPVPLYACVSLYSLEHFGGRFVQMDTDLYDHKSCVLEMAHNPAHKRGPHASSGGLQHTNLLKPPQQ